MPALLLVIGAMFVGALVTAAIIATIVPFLVWWSDKVGKWIGV